jgi:hypothetical protein
MQSLKSLSSNQLMLVLNRCGCSDTASLLLEFTEQEIQYAIDLVKMETFKFPSRRPDYERGDYEW